MKFESSLVEFVGKMPFTNRSRVRETFKHSARSAIRGRVDLVQEDVASIRRLKKANYQLAVYGLLVGAIHVADALHDVGSPLLAGVEAGVSLVVAAGFGVSALSQEVILGRMYEHEQIATKTELNADTIDPRKNCSPSTLEKVVTHGGTLLMMSAGAHAAYAGTSAVANHYF